MSEPRSNLGNVLEKWQNLVQQLVCVCNEAAVHLLTFSSLSALRPGVLNWTDQEPSDVMLTGRTHGDLLSNDSWAVRFGDVTLISPMINKQLLNLQPAISSSFLWARFKTAAGSRGSSEPNTLCWTVLVSSPFAWFGSVGSHLFYKWRVTLQNYRLRKLNFPFELPKNENHSVFYLSGGSFLGRRRWGFADNLIETNHFRDPNREKGTKSKKQVLSSERQKKLKHVDPRRNTGRETSERDTSFKIKQEIHHDTYRAMKTPQLVAWLMFPFEWCL